MEKVVRQRKRDQDLKDSFAKRLTECFNLLQATVPGYDQKRFAEEIEVSPSTLSSYMSGAIFPGPETIIKISNKVGKAIDWLLKGDDTDIPADQAEISILDKFRQIRDAGKALEYESYTDYLVNQIQGIRNTNNIVGVKQEGENSYGKGQRSKHIGRTKASRKKGKKPKKDR